MAKTPEVRIGSTAFVFLIGLVLLAVIGAFSGWFSPAATTPTTTPTGTPLAVVPAIEKTNIYISTFDYADFEGEKQKNRVVGTYDLIKSGNSLETDATSASAAVATAAELNGGDIVTVMGDATGYYAEAVEGVAVTETLQPFEIFIKDSEVPTYTIYDDKKDDITDSPTITLSANEVSKVMYLHMERPGDDTYYQFCGVAVDFDDDVLDVRVKDSTGSYTQGNQVLLGDYDELKSLGADAVWEFDTVIKNFDELDIAFLVGTAKDVDPAAATADYYLFDCEKNLQAGKIVNSAEDSADGDVGEAHLTGTITVN